MYALKTCMRTFFSSAVIADDTAELVILLIFRRRPSVNKYIFIFSKTATPNGFKFDMQVPWVVSFSDLFISCQCLEICNFGEYFGSFLVKTYIFDFFSRTATQNGFKFDMQVPLEVFTQICSFHVNILNFVFLVKTHIFDFSRTAARNGFKFDIRVPLEVLSQICSFRVNILNFEFLVNILGHFWSKHIFLTSPEPQLRMVLNLICKYLGLVSLRFVHFMSIS